MEERCAEERGQRSEGEKTSLRETDDAGRTERGRGEYRKA